MKNNLIVLILFLLTSYSFSFSNEIPKSEVVEMLNLVETSADFDLSIELIKGSDNSADLLADTNISNLISDKEKVFVKIVPSENVNPSY